MPINKINCFSVALPNPNCVLTLPSFDQVFQVAEACARTAEPHVTGHALSNARGSWYEWLIMLGVAAWSISQQSAKTMLLLPNKDVLDLEQIYIPDIAHLVSDLRLKVGGVGGSLITSNPDFVIVDRSLVNVTLPMLAGSSTGDAVVNYANLHQQLLNNCGLSDVVGYGSSKVSMRPDRRIQFVHEGSVLKALHKHIQTRLWLPGLSPILYYAISQTATAADAAALTTVATHSIVSVDIKPQPAVDCVFEIASGAQLQAFCQQVLV